ncbi:MAG: ATP-binding protein [Roseiarcus sp.]|uniref:sensor histidine kinase n=1 Tax=Roseiarcus sp. TaxID=1969460 RepID=UPI003C6A32E6
MPSLSIRARLIFLSVLLLAILAVSSLLLIRELARVSHSLAEEATLVSVVKNANSASKHFGDLKYWVIDAAVTQLARSQQAADTAKAALDSDLTAISTIDPALVAAIGREVGAMTDLARQAGVAYSSDDSAAGNALLEQAKSHVLTIDGEIDRVVDRVEQRAVARRDASTRGAELAVKLAIVGGVGALLLALGFTALTVRSITVPLKQLERSMASITQGDLDPAMPRTGAHEIGAMITTLGILRDSLIERERLERERERAQAEIRAARDAAEAALHELKAAQANLIQAEKMASLGQLTAGIAHEIKNPLNFVNNFASLSIGLLDELKAVAAPALASLDQHQRGQLDEVIELLTGNLERIGEHGKRADNIVKSMLAHSRASGGDRQNTDLNALVEESLNLAYHGARAQDQNFNITLDRQYAPDIPPVELVPQDVTRVFLNLFGNGFYAASERQRSVNDGTFRPALTVTTRDLGKAVEVRVRDNGVGIPHDIKDKLFQPFFTTKPTGVGTGLGLSISYDIVTKQHGGTIKVDSDVGRFTEFIVTLPHRFSAGGAAETSTAGRQS